MKKTYIKPSLQILLSRKPVNLIRFIGIHRF